ncbi:MAG: hypothetical protein DRO15_05140 [Thermoprotei archaeon]|mgnify:CR=1 FL=1|nr:MAG: hypothetical protein DRO15_05140 [Thermoprotei archaeon]
MKPSFIDLVVAEFKNFFIEFLRRKSLIIALVMYPYLLTALIMFIGTMFGSLEYFKQKIPADPLLFFLASSLTLLISLVIIDDIGARFIWEERMGTLPYLMLIPTSTAKLILASPIPRLALTSCWVIAVLAPTAIVIKGVGAGLAVVLTCLIATLGALCFVGLALIIGGLLILSRGEWSIYWVIRPLILFISGIFYPTALMPIWLRILSMTLPLSYAIEASRMLIAFENPEMRLILINVTLMTALAILYTPLGLKTYAYLEVRTKKLGGLRI